MSNRGESEILAGLSRFQEIVDDEHDCFITFEDSEGEHWFQVTNGPVINFDWPFAAAPDAAFESRFLRNVGIKKFIGWDGDTYASYELKGQRAESLAGVIESVFRDLYEVPEEHPIRWNIEYI